MAAAVPTTGPESPPTIIRPAKRRVRLRELVTGFEVARMIGQRDIKAKYKQSALGMLWLLIGPLGMLIAVTIAFSGVTSVHTGDVPYMVFALVGLTVWTYMQMSITIGATAIVGNSSLVRRSTVPRLALVFGGLLGNLPAASVMLAASVVLAAIYGVLPLQAFLLPVLLVWLLALVGGIALLISSVAVRFRDVTSVIPLVLQAGLFVSPVGYPLAGAPANIHTLLMLNPVSGMIEAWRWSLLGIAADTTVIAISLGWTALLAVSGWIVFSRLEVHFADVI
jgi:ABC-type polysaccharide/polyol phosphate export permease